MCLGIPGRVVDIVDADTHIATVDVSGVRRDISVQLLADEGVGVGDWVLVHVGFAMAKIDEDEARFTLDQVARMGQAYRDELTAFTDSSIT
ncbi:MAG: HypC/HybG/HupF family hydrogenase formation chaperone [Dermatophilaceae bacterium]